MSWPTIHRINLVSRKRPYVWLHLFAVLLAVVVLTPKAQTAHADTGVCNTSTGCTNYPPPDLLNLNQSLYAATPAQASSLSSLEDQAINNVVKDHGLAATDYNAVKSWGRADAEAELFALLVTAIERPKCSAGQTPGNTCRSTDQQNAVDWLSAIEQRKAVLAAQDAGLEYVKWAGLDQLQYQSLLNSYASQSTLQTFLSGTPEPYNNRGSLDNHSASTGGYCIYQSPAPYQSDYTTNIIDSPSTADPSCFGSGGLGSLFGGPTPPSYDQFVKWGEAEANYSLLNSSQFSEEGNVIASALGFGLAAGAGSLALAAVPAIAVGTTAETAAALAAADGVILPEGALSALFPFSVAVTAGAVLAVAAIVILAVVTAVLQGINVISAAKLPGQLASLISNAETTPPDPATLESTAAGATSIFSDFVGATLPMPANQTCDDSNPPLPPGLTVTSGHIIVENAIPCLNPTPIPPAGPTDSQFLIQARDSTTQTASPTITWKDTASGAATTARLSESWFVEQTNGSTVQTLSMAYTDWSGKEQNAWLVLQKTGGYGFLTYSAPADTSTPVDPSTCVAQGICSLSSTIDYVGSDGTTDYSASVQGYTPPTGSPSYSTAVEGSPITFKAGGFAPGKAVAPVTYQWRFQEAGCGIPCQTIDPTSLTAVPAYTDPVSGDTATYTWQTSGSYYVSLTATDKNGLQANDTFSVSVGDVPPRLAINPANPRVARVGTATLLGGTINHAGSLDNESVQVNWGDGSFDGAGAGPNTFNYAGNPLTLTASSDNLSFTVSDSHTYATPGIYYPTVWAYDSSIAGVIQTVKETIWTTPTLTWSAPAAITYGAPLNAAQLDASATYSGSSVPGSFAYTADGNPVTAGAVLSAGTHTLAASFTATQPDVYHSPTPASASLIVNPAPLTVTANNQVLPQGVTPPPFTASSSGLVNNDSLSSIGVSCAARDHQGNPVSSSTPPGAYPITCSGSPNNYSAAYHPGTLYITKPGVDVVASATSDSGSVSLGGSSGSLGSLTLTGSGGSGALALAEYTANPGPADPFNSTNSYIDVTLHPGSTFTSLQLVDCNLGPGNMVYWFNGSKWVLASKQSYSATTHCVTVTIDAGTIPSLSQLSSSFFGALEDFTPPTTRAHATLGSGTTAYLPGNWTNQPVRVILSATDNPGGAGLAATYYRLDGGAAVPYTAGSAIAVSSQGKHTLTYWSVDFAGNVEDQTAASNSIAIDIDTTPPTIRAGATTADGKPYSGAWTNQGVTVRFSCADQPTLSGLKSCPAPVTIATEGQNQQVRGTAWDVAGNSSSATFGGINIDRTSPIVVYAGNAGTYTVDQTIAIACSASDPIHNGVTSGVASTTCASIHAPAYTFSLGSHSYSATAADRAGNVGSGSASFVVRVTFDSLCTLTKQFVPEAGHPEAMCAALQGAKAAAAIGSSSKAGFLTVYQHLVAAQAGRTITQSQATILEHLAGAL